MSRMNLACSIILSLAAVAGANEVGYIEDFALANNRADVLKQLIPGSEDYYYYHCLHYQQTGQFDKVDELLKLWQERHGRTARLEEIVNRNALLSYDANHKKTLDFLRWRLALNFDHRKEIVDQKPTQPTRLDPVLIARDTLMRSALSHYSNLQGFEDSALEWFSEQKMSGEHRRELLSRLKRPDLPGITKLIVDDLHFAYSSGFGSLEIHKLLLLSQLDELLTLMPELLNQTQFVNIYMSKLQASPDTDIQYNAKERQSLLERQYAFVQRLAPAHNSLKAHVLYHRLEFDREQGVYDKNRFMEYLKLPRPTEYMKPQYIETVCRPVNGECRAYLNQDFSAVTRYVPVNNDEPLVREFLEHFFIQEDDFQPYTVFARDDYIKEVFAETKILNGISDMEKWYSLLNDPAKYQRLKDRIDLEFALTNKTWFLADDPVSLDIDVKNVKTLIVKVFEINAMNYYREKNREVDTSINLDGLVANEEKTYTYDEPQLRRMRRHYEFPALKKAGVYVVEFIGNGMSSRALIHKGHLRFVERTGTAGHVFNVMDERNRAVKDASIWLAGHEYTADKDGEITIPFSTDPGHQNIILSQGNVASFETFEHKGETYALSAGFYVDREALIKRRKAEVLVRPQLTLTGNPATLTLLEDVALQIQTVDRDGVGTTKEISDFKVFDDKESTYEFQTPDNIVQVSFTLRARVKSLTQQKKLDLSSVQSFALNRIDTTEKIETLHLDRTADGYFLQMLGKTGEALADRPVALNFKHNDFREAAHAQLQSDAEGKIVLGALPGIRTITANLQDGQAYSWILPQDFHNYFANVNGKPDQVIHIPYMGGEKQPSRTEFSLLEQRGGTFVKDWFETMSIDGGFLEIKGLPAGDYSLLIKNLDEQVAIRIADGEARSGWVVGENRLLETVNSEPLQIASVENGADAIKIQLKNANKYARVHVTADRFVPAYSIFSHLNHSLPEPESVALTKTISHYLTGRNIGDEYRYILERRYATKYPGNMLPRASLLLNPWALRTTDTAVDEAAGGGSFGSRGGGGRKLLVMRHGGSRAEESDSASMADVDFLTSSGILLANLAPDKDGVVTIARKDLGEHQFIRVFAADTANSVYRDVALPEAAFKPLDLRLATGLDVAKHFTEQKEITVLAAGQSLNIDDIATSTVESFDTLSKVYALYMTLCNDEKLHEFSFLLDWPKLKAEEKREKYSKYACHELNFFLSRKDPEFFKAVIQPYLVNKKDKTFMDRYLIGDDLAVFLQPWQHERLNVLEQILLAQRIAAEQDPATRHVKEVYDLIPPDLERFNFLFKTALQGNALETADTLGVREATGKVVEANERRQRKLDKLDAARDEAGVAANNAPAKPAAAAAPAPVMEQAKKELEANDDRSDRIKAKSSQKAQEKLNKASKDAKGGEAGDLKQAGQQEEAQKALSEDVEKRAELRQFYRKLDKTEELAENNYYRLPIEQQNGGLIVVNAFWKDYAANWNKPPFVSGNLAEASHSFTEVLCALAVLDLPFEAAKHESQFKDSHMTLNAKGSIVVYHKEIKESAAAEKTPVLVSQNFFRADDRYRFENNERFDKYVTEEFLVHTVYGCQIVLTNPTSSPQKLDLLLQIPRGAMPATNGFYTKGHYVQLQPYSTTTYEYFFYFPQPGEFTHYPVHVARNGRMIASAATVTLKAVNKLTKIDTESWDFISQNGTDEQVITYLKANNIHRINLDRIAWRMKDAAMFKNVTDLLAGRHAYSNTLWSYGIVHDEAAAIREFLTHADGFIAQSGTWLDCKILSIDPMARRTYQHLEYSPLVNARAHRLGKERKILNDRFFEQYIRLLNVLKYKPTLDDTDRLGVAYYMLLQDRIEDGLAFFKTVNADKVATRLQYDYVKAYTDFYTDDHKVARAVAVAYKDYPVDRWKKVFVDVVNQLDEAEGKAAPDTKPEDRAHAMENLAASEANFDFKVEGKKVQVAYQNLAGCTVNYYPMDIELLFSSNPFVHDVNDQFSYVRPVKTETQKFPEKGHDFEFEVPKEFQNLNVMVELNAGGARKSQAYYANALNVQTIENYGQVKVTAPKDGAPMPKVYVKVYSKMQDGNVRFYKDGYTDLRGRFDYASLSTNEIDNVSRFAVLVMSDSEGAIIREAAPPKR